MQPPVPLLQVLTIPPGATSTQQRIVIDGIRGAIFEYGAGNPLGNLVSSWASKAGVDPYGNVYPQGFSAGSGSVFAGTDFIISTAGIFFFNGTPATGNLAFSFAATPGTILGNSYAAGFWSYTSSGAGSIALLSGVQPTVYFVPPFTTHVATQAQLYGFADNPGAVNELIGISLYSGQEAGANGNAFVQLFSASNDGTILAQGRLGISGTTFLEWGGGGNLSITTTGGLSGTPDFSNIDPTTDTNANNGSQPMTMQWSIPADDANVNTIYEVVTEFSGNTGTASSGTLGFKPTLNGAVLATSNGDTIGSTAWPAVNTGFTGEIRVIVKVKSIGALGTADVFIKGMLAIQGNLQGSGNSDWSLSSQKTGQAFDSLNANTIAINSVWGSSIAGQTIISDGSIFTRKGP